MSDIILGTATRQNLLSLQGINDNLGTTQGHLSSGLKVASALDDAVKFFQSQSLNDRAGDLSLRKDTIDQGISSLTTAVNATQSAISVLQQLQGILNSAKTQTAAQRKSAAQQFSTLAQQLDTLLNDASYQGLNLVTYNSENTKVFTYMKTLTGFPQRVEMHSSTFYTYGSLIQAIMNLLCYYYIAQGDNANPQVRPIAIAEKYAREGIRLLNIPVLLGRMGFHPTINQVRFS